MPDFCAFLIVSFLFLFLGKESHSDHINNGVIVSSYPIIYVEHKKAENATNPILSYKSSQPYSKLQK